MTQSYSFASDTEPTEEQLNELMQAVLREVKERASIANEAFKALQLHQIEEAFEKRRQKIRNNA